MEISILGLVGIALATMFFGYFFGLFEGRGQGYKKGKQERADDHQPRRPAETTARHPRSNSLLELARGEGGAITLLLDGRTMQPQQVSTEDRRRVIELVGMMKPWVEPGGAAPAVSAPSMASRPQATKTAATASAASTVKSAAAQPAKAQESAVAQTSLVGQIDFILQSRLAGSALATKGIHLGEAPQGGALVYVGQTQYDGVDKVPDPAIREAIHAAIAEWEEKFPPR